MSFTPAFSDPHDALVAAVEHVGTQAAMAQLLGISQPSVWKWLNKKRPLPPEHVLTVEAATGISRHDLRPDIYPREAPRPPAGHNTLGDLEPAR